MTVTLNPYLNFRGTAREAIEFYQTVFGGELRLSTFADFQMEVPEAELGLVMHSQLSGGGLMLMASDTPSYLDYAPGINNFSVSLSGDDRETLTGYFEKLLDGATDVMPLAEAPWGDTYGHLTDKFGVAWLMNIAPTEVAQTEV